MDPAQWNTDRGCLGTSLIPAVRAHDVTTLICSALPCLFWTRHEKKEIIPYQLKITSPETLVPASGGLVPEGKGPARLLIPSLLLSRPRGTCVWAQWDFMFTYCCAMCISVCSWEAQKALTLLSLPFRLSLAPLIHSERRPGTFLLIDYT